MDFGLRMCEGRIRKRLTASHPQSAIRNSQLARGRGCPYCCQTGTRARKAVYEILPVSPRFAT